MDSAEGIKSYFNDQNVTIIGYGSLLSLKSAKRTCKSISNFRSGEVIGYERCFNLVSIWGIKNNISDLETNEIAAVSTRQIEESNNDKKRMFVSIFDINKNELEYYLERESRYEFDIVDVVDLSQPLLDDNNDNEETNNERRYKIIKALICVQSNDERYKENKFMIDNVFQSDEYYEKIGQYYDGKLWKLNDEEIEEDIYPMRGYLNLCLNAAYELGSEKGLNNFLDTSFLNRKSKTSIREYLEEFPERKSDIVTFKHTNNNDVVGQSN
eukprot:TRINITY_DN16566_c0_g1_i1.p1 TRINITY_DN16566_c0_g1~~TRINITY_DN16566_c0_g1_i1.p1  ORF type:complete len:269 (+),score=62.68 TRINITY_DN16566_c0_g1_i1:39-845(+)